jgi:uncharacterized protein (TIGR00251 family)
MNLRVRVQARAKRNVIVPWQDGQWKLYVTAPAVEGQANEACVEFLARMCGISRSRVRIVSGEKSRNKVVSLEGITEEAFARRLLAGQD